MTFDQLIGDLKKKIYAPLYFLQGGEPYYIDQISDYIENNVLTESEKEFNQSILYGKDLDVPTLVSYAKRYPMMSNYQVVIVKEAQEIKGLLPKDNPNKEVKDLFLDYLQQPMKSTLLVLCYKYKSLDKRTKLYKAIQKNGLLFDSAKLYEDKLPGWIHQFVLSKGYRIDAKSSMMMAEHLGNDLSKIANEIDKLSNHIKPGDEITVSVVQEHIGISKEFNVFELQTALGKRNIYKANLIANYFASNPKNGPIIMITATLYNYFMKVMTYHTLSDRSSNNVASSLGIHPYFVSDYETAARSYTPDLCVRNIGYLREYDNRSKGVMNASTDHGDLIRELVFKILH